MRRFNKVLCLVVMLLLVYTATFTKQAFAASTTSVVEVAGGNSTGYAIDSSGHVWAWGYGADGEIGNGKTNISQPSPVLVSGLTGINKIAATWFGNNSSTAYAIDSNGHVWAWGYGANGELGNGTTSDSSTSVQVTGLSNITDIAAGQDFVCALDSGGHVWAWGNGIYGSVFGNGTAPTKQTVHVQISSLSGIIAIAAGNQDAYALDSSGHVWVWGNNNYGGLGNGTINSINQTTPIQIASLAGITSIKSFGGTAYALDSSGHVWAWGEGDYGQLGNGATTNQGTPLKIPSLSNITNIFAGEMTAFAIDSSGNLWAWGYDADGELGNGTAKTTQTTPTEFSLYPGGVSTVSTGTGSFYTITTSGSALSWGVNSDGELGNGLSGASRYSPASIAFPNTISLSASTTTLTPGQSVQLTVTDSYYGDITSQAGFSSSNTSVATVSNSGLVVAVAVGSTTIKCFDNSDATAESIPLIITVTSNSTSSSNASLTQNDSANTATTLTLQIIPTQNLSQGSWLAIYNNGLSNLSGTILSQVSSTGVPGGITSVAGAQATFDSSANGDALVLQLGGSVNQNSTVTISISDLTNAAAGSYPVLVGSSPTWTPGPQTWGTGQYEPIPLNANVMYNVQPTSYVQTITVIPSMQVSSVVPNQSYAVAPGQTLDEPLAMTVATNATSFTVSLSATPLEDARGHTIPDMPAKLTSPGAWPSSPAWGYAITSASDPSLIPAAMPTDGTEWAAFNHSGTDSIVSSSAPTGDTAASVTMDLRVAPGWNQAAGSYSSTIQLTVTPSFTL